MLTSFTSLVNSDQRHNLQANTGDVEAREDSVSPRNPTIRENSPITPARLKTKSGMVRDSGRKRETDTAFYGFYRLFVCKRFIDVFAIAQDSNMADIKRIEKS